MEDFLAQILKTQGLNVVGFAMLYFYMKNNFSERKEEKIERTETLKQVFAESFTARKENRENIDKLCEKIEKMVDLLHDYIVKDTQTSTITKEQLTKICENQEFFKTKLTQLEEKIITIDLRTQMCPNTEKTL